MIQGVAMPKASARRTANASMIAPVSRSGKAMSRSRVSRSSREPPKARDSVAKADLARPSRDLGQLRVVHVDPDLVRGLRDVARNRVPHVRASAEPLDRSDVEVGDVAEVVLRLRGLQGGRRHP